MTLVNGQSLFKSSRSAYYGALICINIAIDQGANAMNANTPLILTVVAMAGSFERMLKYEPTAPTARTQAATTAMPIGCEAAVSPLRTGLSESPAGCVT